MDVPAGYLRRVNATVRTLDPVAAVADSSEAVVTKLHDGLVHHPNGELTPEPLLAADLDRDGETYTVRLREARFHDGSPVTAADVVYSFERVAAAPASRHASLLLDTLGVVHETDDGAYVPGSLGVEAVDDRTVEIELADPYHAARDVLAHPALSVVPAGAVDDVPGHDGDRSQAAFADEPVGCGPFRFESWVEEGSGEHLRVARFDDYHRGPAGPTGISWRTGRDGDTRYEWLAEAEIDMSGVPNVHYDPDAVTVEREEAGRKTGTYELAGRTLNYVNVTPLTVFYLAFDTTSVPRAVRRAVAYVHDQAADTAAAFKGRRSAAYHLTPRVLYPGGPEAAEAHAATYPYGQGVDVERARGETEAAGYGPDDRFAFEFAVTPSQDWKRLADILQERLAAAHVDMSVRTMDARELQEAGAAGELDAYYGGWIADWPAAESAIRPLDPDRSDTDEDDPLTYTNWTGPAAERARAAFDRLRANTGPGEAAAAARAEAVVAAERANWEDVAILPTYQYVSESVWHRWIDTPLPGPLGFRRLKHHEVTVGERE